MHQNYFVQTIDKYVALYGRENISLDNLDVHEEV